MNIQNNNLMVKEKLKTNIYTYKSSDLIESSYELTIAEQRLISLACRKLQPIYIENRMSLEDFETALTAIKFSDIQISVDEYKKEYNISGKSVYEHLEQTTNELFERELAYYDEKGVLNRRRWVSSAKYNKDNSSIALTFNSEMVKDLLVFKGKYVALFFDMSQNIRSKYAFRLYEILKNNTYSGSYKISLDELKFMLAIDGYKEYHEFNRRVLKPNIEAINTYSDILVVDIKSDKVGRTTVGLTFILKEKQRSAFIKNNKDFTKLIPKSYKEISKALEKYNTTLTSEEAEKIFTTATNTVLTQKINTDVTSYILEKIEFLEIALMTTDITNLPGFIDWMVKTNYTPEKNFIKQTPKKLGFDNFEGRNHGEEYYDDIEKKLLGWDNEAAITEEDYEQETLWD